MSSYCSLLVRNSSLNISVRAATVSPNPSVSTETVTILSLDSGLGSSKSAFLSNFNRMVESALLIVGVQRLKDILSIVHTNLRP